MELASITEIRELKNSLKIQISQLNKSDFKDSFYGSENEYTYRGLIGGVDCLLTDITTLTKAPNQFLKLSTYKERQAILNGLKNIEAYIKSPDNLWQHLDILKAAIRPFHIRYTKERLLDFDEEISNVVRRKQLLEDGISEIEKVKSNNEELLDNLIDKNNNLSEFLEALKVSIDNTDLKNSDLLEKLKSLSLKLDTGDELIEKATDIVESTSEYLAEAKASTSSIQEFENTIEKRQKQADNIDSRTIEYKNNIETFEAERVELNNKAKETISNALKALEYNTARGLSASFQTQLEKIESSSFNRWLWGAGAFLVLTLAIGIWIVVSGHGDISATIGRVVLTSFTITGAVFCANQYIRQKNVMEDYSYKMVLAKSIVGFSEQLNNGQENSQEYKDYIQLALSEIHKDPLRKRVKSEKEIDGGVKSGVDMVIETAQKIAGLANGQ